MRRLVILSFLAFAVALFACSDDNGDNTYSPNPSNNPSDTTNNPSDSTNNPSDSTNNPNDTADKPADTLPLKIGCNNSKERQLIQKIRNYRDSKGLKQIPLSQSMTTVADYHVADLNKYSAHKDRSNCNLHTWSSNWDWPGCCYKPDHSNASCIWDKPRQITNYTGNGYEIAFWSGGSEADPQTALETWQQSSGHNTVIVNEGQWSDVEWNAMGVSIAGNYAVVWFGKKDDPEGKPDDCS